MSEAHTQIRTARIPKPIDAEVLLFKNYTVKQCFPAMTFACIWYIAFTVMSDGTAKWIMTASLAISAFIFGKKMGDLVLYEHALLFLRYIFLKPKIFLRITRDVSLEPDEFETNEVVTQPMPEWIKQFDGLLETFKTKMFPKK